jgi:hypothetical protein
VLVEDGLGHPGGVGDVAHRRDVETLVGEDAQRDLEQLASASGSR